MGDAGRAEVTNVGTAPVTVTDAAGDGGFLAFRSVTVAPAGRGGVRSARDLPPLASAGARLRTVVLPPGKALTLPGWSRRQEAIKRIMPGGGPAPRQFVVDYRHALQLDGQSLSATVRATATAQTTRAAGRP